MTREYAAVNHGRAKPTHELARAPCSHPDWLSACGVPFQKHTMALFSGLQRSPSVSIPSVMGVMCIWTYSTILNCIIINMGHVHTLTFTCLHAHSFTYAGNSNFEEKSGQFMGGALASNGENFIVSV